jgi:hypothetical protein
MKTLGRLAISAILLATLLQAQPQVALLDSAHTKTFFRLHYNGCPFYLPDGEEYTRYFMGWQYALNQSPDIPFTVIQDADVTDSGLAPFKVLILSNAASLNKQQTEVIHQWVVRGGRLLATFGSGYKSTRLDPREADGLRRQKGHTFGLHELWHDPMTTVFSSFNLASGVDIRITEFEGPTGCSDVESTLAPLDNVLPYGAEANILVQRPENYPAVLGFVQFLETTDWNRPTPAILSTRAGRGRVVYYAFAPEFVVSLAYVAAAQNPSCNHDAGAFANRADKALPLMRCTVSWLLGN